jgi:hypothetical protein
MIFHSGKNMFVANPEAFGFRLSRDELITVLGFAENVVFPLGFRLRVRLDGESEYLEGILP